MSRRPPPKGEIMPEQRGVRFEDDPEAIPLREPPPPPQHYQPQQQQQPRHGAPQMQPRNVSPGSRQPQPSHQRRPSKERQGSPRPSKGDHIQRSSPAAGVSHRQLERLRQAFIQFDTNHSGTIDKEEFKYALRKMKIEMSEAEIDELFDSVDQNADGVIDFDEYMRLMTNRLHETNKEDGMLHAYNLLTDKRTGKISLRTLRRASRDLAVGLTEHDLDVMFVEADIDGDGFIDTREFEAVVRRCGMKQDNMLR